MLNVCKNISEHNRLTAEAISRQFMFSKQLLKNVHDLIDKFAAKIPCRTSRLYEIDMLAVSTELTVYVCNISYYFQRLSRLFFVTYH